MPLDAVFLSALTAELAPQLVGAKIDKLQQPARDRLLLSLRTREGNRRLLIAASSSGARVHFTRESPENPAEPPMFCMLLRKHLNGARILSLTQPEHERLLLMELESRDELGDTARRTLAVELIGRSANVVLVGADGRIIDCLRRMDFAGERDRALLPGMLYRRPPRQDKTDLLASTGDDRAALLAAADRTRPMDKWLLETFSGLSPLWCRELAFRCGEDWDAIGAELDAFCGAIGERAFRPSLLTLDGEPFDYSFLPVAQYGARGANEAYEDFSTLLDAFYARRDREELRRRRSRELTHAVRGARERLLRKLDGQRAELRETADRDMLLRRAELVTANLYRLKKGDARLVCEDYYEPDAPETVIELDPLKTPQANAAALYKRYNKLKAAETHLTALIAEGEKQLDYLDGALDALERAESERDLADLRRELTEQGVLRRKKNEKTAREKPQQPLRYVTDDGLEVLVGRTGAQNDELTTKIGRRTDRWLHTQKVHGSHVILRCDGREPPPRSIEQAASLAVWHSQARGGGKTPVDCTMLRNVRKPAGALPGKVIYTDYTTLITEGDEALAERLRKKGS